jgi:DNA-binding NtrC family response regulator
MGRHRTDLAGLASSDSTGATQSENPTNLETMERHMIFEALHATGGHHQKAAARLGISRRTLSRKLKVYGGEGVSANREMANRRLGAGNGVVTDAHTGLGSDRGVQ